MSAKIWFVKIISDRDKSYLKFVNCYLIAKLQNPYTENWDFEIAF